MQAITNLDGLLLATHLYSWWLAAPANMPVLTAENPEFQRRGSHAAHPDELDLLIYCLY